jgi:hypothetical protein
MSIGDTVWSEGKEYEVVWAGRGPLLPPRDSKPQEKMDPPAKRSYKWSGRYSRVKPGVCPECGGAIGKCNVFGHQKGAQ